MLLMYDHGEFGLKLNVYKWKDQSYVNFPIPIVWDNKVGFVRFFWENRSDSDKNKTRAKESSIEVKLSNIGAACMVCGMGFAPSTSDSCKSTVTALKKMRRHLIDEHRVPSRNKVSESNAANARNRLDVGVAIEETLHQNINPDKCDDPWLVPMEMLKGKTETQYKFVKRLALHFCPDGFTRWCPYNTAMKVFLRRFYTTQSVTEEQFKK
jgi:hypothetical protein